jgi:carboxypeptidase Taq
MDAESAYAELIRRTREQSLLGSCAAVLSWDEETYMPAAGVAHRSEQLAWLTTELHARATDPRILDLVETVERSTLVGDASSAAAVNVREIRRAFERETRIPSSVAEELARVTTLAQQEWVVARADDDFARFRPWLERIVALRRVEADAVGYVDEPYDALLDEYEPGTTTRDISRLYDAIRQDLVPLVAAVTGCRRQPKRAAFHALYPEEQQRSAMASIAAAIGFDFSGGRLDTSAHPFAIHIGPGDCRLTVRYDVWDATGALFGVMHEGGHGLYDQGLDVREFGTPIGEAASQGLHESQARLWENRVGRGHAFWQYALPLLRSASGDAFAGLSADEAYFAANAVAASTNRVRADELTYNLHVLVRFELERELVSGKLAASDVPEAWNALYARYLGITPASDADGCLQDSHWAAGLIGYFPTYTLGDVYAAQLYVAAERAIGDLDAAMARGEFGALREWLREHIHRHGHRLSASALIKQATGESPNVATLVAVLRAKYGALYGLI